MRLQSHPKDPRELVSTILTLAQSQELKYDIHLPEWDEFTISDDFFARALQSPSQSRGTSNTATTLLPPPAIHGTKDSRIEKKNGK